MFGRRTPMDDLKGAVVLTTHERSGFFTAVLGDNIDLRLDPRHIGSLHDVLHNVLVADGSLVVLDEAFFVDVDDLALGLEEFVKHERDFNRLRIVVVCSHRMKGDPLLAFLVGFCGIFDIIFGTSGVEVSIRLSKLLECANTRIDVIDLLEEHSWLNLTDSEDETIEPELPARPESLREIDIPFAPIALDQHVEVEGMHGLHVHIELSPDPS